MEIATKNKAYVVVFRENINSIIVRKHKEINVT